MARGCGRVLWGFDYRGITDVDINNKLRQHSLGLEAAVHTENPWRRMMCSVIGVWVDNSWNMITFFSNNYSRKKKGDHMKYITDIILGGLFSESGISNNNPVLDTLPPTRSNTNLDPYVHPMRMFKEVGGGTYKQQRCVMCDVSERWHSYHDNLLLLSLCTSKC